MRLGASASPPPPQPPPSGAEFPTIKQQVLPFSISFAPPGLICPFCIPPGEADNEAAGLPPPHTPTPTHPPGCPICTVRLLIVAALSNGNQLCKQGALHATVLHRYTPA